ncbi:MAG: response regulator [Brevinematales bacterium]|jgi:PAS domain S-box-containing protein
MSASDKKSILLVEDEMLISLSEKFILEKSGYKVITAYSGETAVETIRNAAHIDLVLMDINLGNGMDGTHAAVLILEKRDVPVVFLSSHTEQDIVEKTEGITSYGYIVKNSGETVLLASIKMAFRLFEAKQKEREKEDELLNSKILLEQTFEQSPVPMTLISMPEMIFRIINPSCRKFLGIDDEPSYVGTSLRDYKPSYENFDLNGNISKASELPLARVLAGNGIDGEERIIVRKDGTICRELVYGVPIRNVKGEILAAYFIRLDITGRKETEIALQEVYHRMRNNIVSIEVLLDLHMQALKIPEAVSILEEIISRTKRTRIVYEILLESDDYSDVSMKYFSGKLIDKMVSLFPDNGKIAILKKIGDFILKSKFASVMGIVMSELIAVALEYSFKGRLNGRLEISVSKENDIVGIAVTNNGASDDEMPEKGRFGYKFIDVVINQYGGTFRIEKSAEGTKCIAECRI